jgi:hypothetical protein
MIDAPFASRIKYPLLRYSVSISSMPSLYARRTKSKILSVTSSVVSPTQIAWRRGRMLDSTANQILPVLSELEQIISDEPSQYAWTANSVFLSDPAAREASISFALDALRWRSEVIPDRI